ncbi:hypothetical protein [Sphingomonas trueperi]|uniref:hypothetical protein n=1 Tax=Sphingomonas trueperi TaxID=53317 RepID=UPI0011C3BF42
MVDTSVTFAAVDLSDLDRLAALMNVAGLQRDQPAPGGGAGHHPVASGRRHRLARAAGQDLGARLS